MPAPLHQGTMKKQDKNLLAFAGAAFLVAAVVSALTACAPPKGTFAGNPTGPVTSLSGYVVVSNTTFRNVVLMDPSFNYVRTLYQAGAGDVPWGLGMFDSSNILVSVEGLDRVLKVNINTGAISTIISDVNVTGTMRGVARLSGGDIIVVDQGATNQVERFTVGTDGYTTTRVTAGWPSAQGTTVVGLWPQTTTANNFLSCSTGTDTVRTNNNAGTQVLSASATLPVPSLGAAHDVVACIQNSAGQIAVAYNGATDSVRVYPSTLASTTCTFTDAVAMPNPAALAVRANGNYLVFDNTNNAVIELNSSCTQVASYSTNYLNTVNQMLVLP